MTRKEAITNLNMISVAFVEPVTKGQRELIDDTFNMAIKALEQLTSYEQTINKLTEAISEQATILDKITDEISALIDWHDCPIEYDNGNDAWYCEACNQAIKIVDKYKARREETG